MFFKKLQIFQYLVERTPTVLNKKYIGNIFQEKIWAFWSEKGVTLTFTWSNEAWLYVPTPKLALALF